MRYVVDLEAYSLLLRPGETDTEVVQFSRAEYSADEAARLYEGIRAQLPGAEGEWLVHAPLVFVYLLQTDQLLTKRGLDSAGNEHWFVADAVSGHVFDFAEATEGSTLDGVHRDAEVADSGEADGRPPVAALDLIERVQPSAQRYMVDEVITLESMESSEFLAHKQAMDYLYQRGVFGKL